MRVGRLLECADIDRVAEHVGRMHGEVQYYCTVAAKSVRHRVPVVAAYIERVDMRRVLRCSGLTPCMRPFVRQLAVGHERALRINDDTIPNDQTQLNDTVASVQRL